MSDNKQQRARKAPGGGLRTIKLLVAAGYYDWSEKVQNAIEDGWFEPEDLERCIETGKVAKVKKDVVGGSVGQKTYAILGSDCSGCRFYTAGKIVKAARGQEYFFITAHESKWR
jgi:hypothetical protein